MTTREQAAEDPIAERLAGEFRELTSGPNAAPPLVFAVDPFDVYTLVAVLQLVSRHPRLSVTQRLLVDRLAHQFGDALAAVANARFGEPSATALTMAMGFEPGFDVDTAEEDDEGDPPLALADFLASDEGSVVTLGDRPCRYVVPAYGGTVGEDPDSDLLKCSVCARFFLQTVPLRAFQDLGDEVVLGYEICAGCEGKVMARMQQEKAV